MVVWSGWGLAALLPALLFPALGLTLTGIGVDDSPALAATLQITGLAGFFWIRWFDGWRERKSPPRVLLDPRTGQEVTHQRRDTLFWIPIKYLWVPYGLLPIGGVIVLIQVLIAG